MVTDDMPGIQGVVSMDCYPVLQTLGLVSSVADPRTGIQCFDPRIGIHGVRSG